MLRELVSKFCSYASMFVQERVRKSLTDKPEIVFGL